MDVESEEYFFEKANRSNVHDVLTRGTWLVRPSSRSVLNPTIGRVFAISFKSDDDVVVNHLLCYQDFEKGFFRVSDDVHSNLIIDKTVCYQSMFAFAQAESTIASVPKLQPIYRNSPNDDVIGPYQRY
jgi:hypothetical protein